MCFVSMIRLSTKFPSKRVYKKSTILILKFALFLACYQLWKSFNRPFILENDLTRSENQITKLRHETDGMGRVQTMTKKALEEETKPLPPHTLGAFIHVGKTGGSTISTLLRNGCHTFVAKPCLNETQLSEAEESALSKLTTYYHVPDFVFGGLSNNHKNKPYEFFAISLRDPLSRAISSYGASHPKRIAWNKYQTLKEGNGKIFQKLKNNFYDKGRKDAMLNYIIRISEKLHVNKRMYSCFESLEAYAQLLTNFTDYEPNSWTYFFEQNDCVNVAKTTLHHVDDQQPMTHTFWDLRQILYQVNDNLANKTILAIRNEFLWQDWVSANHWLGDEGEVYYDTDLSARNSTTLNLSIDMELSEEGRRNLCVALEGEYRLYLKLLVLSVNLSEEDVHKSLLVARERCPWLGLKLPRKDQKETFEVHKSQTWTI